MDQRTLFILEHHLNRLNRGQDHKAEAKLGMLKHGEFKFGLVDLGPAKSGLTLSRGSFTVATGNSLGSFVGQLAAEGGTLCRVR